MGSRLSARTHDLSSYTPICEHCGLILCTLNPPHLPCPHCSSSLLTPHARQFLISQVENEILQALAREEEGRQRAVEEARITAGAFPTLDSINDSGSGLRGAADVAPHKVLSLNSKTKKVTLSSYAPSASPLSRSVSLAEPEEEVAKYVLPPSKEIMFAQGGRQSATTWVDLFGESAVYVDVPKGTKERGTNSSKSRTR
ncbi:hypothetical protein EW146_g3018 [Bondarzewia mesenterica]|uniref:TRIP4/RQT4 C2HC5-type zinc finger domain-containing protein n=1 Tax=Bondarzewia mesenterica TaxID=1095465 RepID=A0A4S4M155_9AGAM|nr:hypothetical protein EW146_g3018 [Bondarzewia mesenterica]